MRRALLILTVLALLALAAAIVGQILIFSLGVVFTPNGQVRDPTFLALAATDIAAAGSIASAPLTFATFVLGLVVSAERRRYGWLSTIIVAGVLAFAGLIGMAWILLSAQSPISFFAPLAVIPLVTLLYCIWPARPSDAISRAVNESATRI